MEDTPDVPPPMIQLGFHPLTGWTVVAAKHHVMKAEDLPEQVHEAFREQYGHDMTDIPDADVVGVRVAVKGKVFDSLDDLTGWLTLMLPDLWPWFTNQVVDVPAHLGLEESAP